MFSFRLWKIWQKAVATSQYFSQRILQHQQIYTDFYCLHSYWVFDHFGAIPSDVWSDEKGIKYYHTYTLISYLNHPKNFLKKLECVVLIVEKLQNEWIIVNTQRIIKIMKITNKQTVKV